MALSESGEIIRRLIASGLNMETIGQGISRNRSLVRQVSIGAKPGNNLRGALADLETRLAGVEPERRTSAARTAPVTAPPRRPTKAGAPARVRKPTTHGGRAWATSNVKQQAARHGARGLARPLARAADDGMQVAVTVSFTRRVTVSEYSKGRRGKAGPGGVLDFKLGDAGDVLDALGEGGNLAAYVAAEALAQGYVSGVGDAGAVVANMLSIELRSF